MGLVRINFLPSFDYPPYYPYFPIKHRPYPQSRTIRCSGPRGRGALTSGVRRLRPHRVKNIIPVSLGIGFAISAGIFITVTFYTPSAMDGGRHAVSPCKKFSASLLPFRGQDPHPLDGAVRVFLSNREQTFTDKHQTSLPYTSSTTLDWVPNATPLTFQIGNRRGTQMLWRIEGQKAICLQGWEFLVPDPYSEKDSPQ
jgi:hypothetical protein